MNPDDDRPTNEHGDVESKPRFTSETAPRGYDPDEDPRGKKRKGDSPSALKKAEDAAASGASGKAEGKESGLLHQAADRVGAGFNPIDSGRFEGLKSFVQGRRKGLLVGGGVGGFLVGGIVLLFMALLPLKINSMVENVQNRFMSGSQSAVSRRTEFLFSNYIKRHVLPSLNTSNCRSTLINKDCVAPIAGESKASRLFRSWQEGKLETTLATKYGVEFYKQGTQYYMKAPGLTQDADISALAPGAKGEVAELRDIEAVGRSQVRQQWMDSVGKETRFKSILLRYRVGKLVERKYGIKRCVIACDTRDDFADWKDQKRFAAKAYLIQRVVAPRTETLGLVLSCVLEPSCDPNASDASDTSGEGGEKRSQFEKDLQAKLDALAAQYGQAAVENIIKDAQLVVDRGFTAYAVDKVVSSFLSEEAGHAAGSAVPFVGAINTAATLVDTIKTAGPKIRKLTYLTNSAAMVSMYMMYRTHADEIKNGHVDAAMVGSFADSLGPGTKKDGSGSGMEATPLYNNLFGDSSSQSAWLDNLLPQKAYAQAATTKTSYLCDDNNPVPAGKLVCPEEDLRASNFFTSLSGLFDKPPLNVVAGAAQIWRNTGGKVLSTITNFFGDIISQIPGLKQLTEKFGEIIQPIMQAVAQFIIPTPFSDDMSGGRTGDMVIGGGDVTYNEFAHHGLGAQVLTAQQSADIINQQETEARDQFARLSLKDRLFSKDSQYSLVSRVAMAMPINANAAISSMATNLIHNPFSTIFHSFGAFFTLQKTHAATAQADPFGITQYGYPINDKSLTTNPDTLTDDYCKQVNENWNNNTTVNSDTSMDENYTTNPCLLEDAVVTAAGGQYDNSLLGQ